MGICRAPIGINFKTSMEKLHREVDPLTYNQLHDDHYGLFLNADSNQFDNVWMIVLLEDSPFLQELPFMFFGHCHSARLYCDFFVCRKKSALENVAEVSLQKIDEN